MKKKIYAIFNTLIILLVIAWNYYSNTGNINGNTVGSLSDKYDNLFTPAAYAFSIWGVIFLALIALTVYQVKIAFQDSDKHDTILKIGPWLSIANIANGAWLWFWLNEQIGISVAIMIVILSALIVAIIRLDMERWDAPIGILAFVWWPICLYSGWISVALIANVSAWLTQLGWNGGVLSEVHWTIIMVSVAGLLNLFMIYTRNMREFALVGAWALIAIAVRHWGEIASIQWIALTWAVLLILAITYHAYLNRATNPLKKFKES